MNDTIREQIIPYLRDDIDNVEITIPQGLIRKALEVSMIQKAHIKTLRARVVEMESNLDYPHQEISDMTDELDIRMTELTKCRWWLIILSFCAVFWALIGWMVL